MEVRGHKQFWRSMLHVVLMQEQTGFFSNIAEVVRFTQTPPPVSFSPETCFFGWILHI